MERGVGCGMVRKWWVRGVGGWGSFLLVRGANGGCSGVGVTCGFFSCRETGRGCCGVGDVGRGCWDVGDVERGCRDAGGVERGWRRVGGVGRAWWSACRYAKGRWRLRADCISCWPPPHHLRSTSPVTFAYVDHPGLSSHARLKPTA